jgi:uncharacterized membrane protein
MTSTAAPGPRYGFVDLLRGFAILVMVETHVVNAYLPPVLKQGSELFFWVAFVNGLVAPAFLFATGFSLILQGRSRWDDWLRFRPPFWRQLRRLGFILLVAYNIHLQGYGLGWYLDNRDNALVWERTFKVDILQCIVASLLVLLLLAFIVRRRSLLPYAAGGLGIAAALVTPWVWARDFRPDLPLALALYLNPHKVSLFPLFPWISFVLAGASAAHYFLRSVEAEAIPRYMKRAAFAGAGMIAAGLLLRSVPWTLPGHVDFYTTSPLYLMVRLGCIFVIVALLYRCEARGAGARWLGPVRLAGQESLLVYGAHLYVIYSLLRRQLEPVLGLEAGYAGCLLMSAAIIALMLPLARGWHALKKRHPRAVRIGQGVVVAAMVVSFLLL